MAKNHQNKSGSSKDGQNSNNNKPALKYEHIPFYTVQKDGTALKEFFRSVERLAKQKLRRFQPRKKADPKNPPKPGAGVFWSDEHKGIIVPVRWPNENHGGTY